MPKISVIIPTYDRVNYLERALNSVFAQTLKDFEVLVVQNGGPENALRLCEKLVREGQPVRYLHVAEAGGANARNVGIKEARGDLIAFLDDDDEWLPEKLAREAAFMAGSAEHAMVFSHPVLVYPNGETKRDEHKVKGAPTYKALIEHGCVIRSFSGVMIRRAAFNEIGLLNDSYLIMNDYDLYLRIARRFRIGIIAEPLYRYYWHTHNLSSDIRCFFEEGINIVRRQVPAPELGVSRELIKESIQKYYRNYCGTAVEARKAGDYKRAFQLYCYGLLHNPLIGSSIKWGRFNHAFYHVLRPYIAALECLAQSTRQSLFRKGAV